MSFPVTMRLAVLHGSNLFRRVLTQSFSLRMWHPLQFFHSTRSCSLETVTDSILLNSTVPSKEQVLVPETLIKKRKAQEAARAIRIAALEKRKKVGLICVISIFEFTFLHYIFYDDTHFPCD